MKFCGNFEVGEILTTSILMAGDMPPVCIVIPVNNPAFTQINVWAFSQQ